MPETMRKLCLLLLLLPAGCVTSPPRNTNDICEIFMDKRGWYRDAKQASRRWDADIPIMMAIIRQESSFRSRAKPPRKRFLRVFPGRRPASAYGYAQALDGTWEAYKKETGRGGADRNDFDDAIDFVGWYNHRSRKVNGISRDDAYNLYLAYHEGHGGYARRTWSDKQWLLDTAAGVSRRSDRYRGQLHECESRLERGFFRKLFGWLFGWLNPF